MGSKPKDLTAEKLFDPGTVRDNPKATNYCETIMHLIKSTIGTGIFVLPNTFKNAGLLLSIIGLIITSICLCNCVYILIQCAHKFYYYSDKPSMTYAEVADYAFENGPQCARKFSKFISKVVAISILITYFGTGIAYTNLAAGLLKELLHHYYSDLDINIRLLCLFLGIPFLLIEWIPNLKALAPLTLVANFFYVIIILISFYYFFTDKPNDLEIHQFNPEQIPSFLASALFALAGIGIALPLENNMKKPKEFIGCNGVIVVGTVITTIIYIAYGAFGYLRYGDETPAIILSILPIEQIPGQIVRVLLFLTLFPTYGLQMYVAYDIIWNSIKERYPDNPFIPKYILRTTLVAWATGIAVAVPVAAPFMFLIGAFCFSVLGIILPVLIQIVTLWDDGFGHYNWMLWKDMILLIYGVFAFIFGTLAALLQIKEALEKL